MTFLTRHDGREGYPRLCAHARARTLLYDRPVMWRHYVMKKAKNGGFLRICSTHRYGMLSRFRRRLSEGLKRMSSVSSQARRRRLPNRSRREDRRGKSTCSARAREAGPAPACPLDEIGRPAFLDRSEPKDLTELVAQASEVGNQVLVLCGVQPETWLHSYTVVASWLKSGADPEVDIYPTVKRLVEGNPNFTPPSSASSRATRTSHRRARPEV